MLSSKSKVYLLGLYEESWQIYVLTYSPTRIQLHLFKISQKWEDRGYDRIYSAFHCPMNCDKQHIQERSAKKKIFETSQIYDLPFHKVAN